MQIAFAQEQPQLVTEATSGTSALARILADWKIYVAAVLILSIGLVALAYAIGQGFAIPELKAWAEVELGEVFTTALLVIFIMGILLFVEQVTIGMVSGYPMMAGACSATGTGYCPAQVALRYVDSYIDAAMKIYEDVFKKNLEVTQEATFGQGIGISYEMYFFGGVNWKNSMYRMIDVEMYNEVLNLLGAVIGTLHAQTFLISFVTLKLAPAALIIGIVLRSFFVTRKLGGLLMAFGIGFLLVFPLMYGLGWFTMDAAVYGINAVAGGPSSTCPQVCTPYGRIAEWINGKPSVLVNRTDVYNAAYQDCMDSLSHLDASGREVSCMDTCVSGYTIACANRCAGSCVASGVPTPPEMGGTPEEQAAWDTCVNSCVAASNCNPSDADKRAYCEANGGCPVITELAGEKEAYCAGIVEGKMSELDSGNITTVGALGEPSFHAFGYCPFDPCGFPIPYHQGCTSPTISLYGSGVGSGVPNVCNTRLFDPGDPIYSQFDNASEINGCPEECRTLAPLKPVLTPIPISAGGSGEAPSAGQTDHGCYDAEVCTEFYTSENEYCTDVRGCIEGGPDDNMYTCCRDLPSPMPCKESKRDCPSQCMWITNTGKSDPTCPYSCQKYRPDYSELGHPKDPGVLWEKNLSNETCMYIIPDVVFQEPAKCSECTFVAEKGLTFKPQMIYDCTSICGGLNAQTMGYENPATTSNSLEGFIGPTEIKSAAKLALPAFILPLLSLAVTLMFITTLSPMLGGDIDLPGMMRMMQ